MASYYDELNQRLTWEIVYTVLEVLWLIPILAVWITSLFTGRRRKDLATRQGNVLLNVAFPIWFISILLCSVAGGLSIGLIVDEKSFSSRKQAEIYSFIKSINHLFQIGWFFGWVASAILLLSMVEFANCFLIATGRARPKMLPTILFFAALGYVALLIVIATAEMGEFENFFVKYYNVVYENTDSSYAEEVAASLDLDNAEIIVNKLDAAYCFLAAIFALAFTGLAAVIVHFTRAADAQAPIPPPPQRKMPGLTHPAVLLLVASLLLVLRFLYGAVIDVEYLIPNSVTLPRYLQATTPILSDWAMSIALVLVFNCANYPLFLANPNRRAAWAADIMNTAQMTAGKEAGAVMNMGGGVQPVYVNQPPQVAYMNDPAYQNGNQGYQNGNPGYPQNTYS